MSTSPYPAIVQPQWPPSGDQRPVYYRQPSTMSRTSPTGPDPTPQIWLIDPSDFYDFGDKTKTAAVTIAERLKAFSKKWFTHILLFIVLMIYASVGAVIFRLIEGPHESPEIIDLPDVRSVMADILWNISRIDNISENEWQISAHLELKKYEGQVFQAISSSATTIDEARQWTFFGSLFFCGTVYTTIGYGNIAPSTTAGRAATIVYAFIGIPLLLMVLADLGKLFTRAIKFLFFFIRQFYYTGKCRKMRRAGRRATAVPVQVSHVMMLSVEREHTITLMYETTRITQWNVGSYQWRENTQ
ncbi:TWiK family of potassium channels protein 18-like [Limulus polyphemus]|uniref:TWiK family of potassium channels protein 18-like n=1 Tax=Limulus polyphemus TaxID=6850 RepID=A0ABM1RWC4_LIMPO|nr:TWiK family of potassium channels protein 18-like [Limulus polyphemus]